MPLLSARGLTVRHSARTILDAVDLDLHVDELTVLLGANGSGKTTLLRALTGLVPAEADTLTVLGHHPHRAPDTLRRRIGWVPDHPDVPAWMTPADCARFHAAHHPTFDGAHLTHLFQYLAVPTTRPFSALSRGEAAKALLALALSHHPDLLVLDEPLARLDPRTKDEVLACLLEHAPADGGACLLATHDLDVAARAADRVIAIRDGRIDTVLDPSDLELVHAEPGGLRATLERTYDRAPAHASR